MKGKNQHKIEWLNRYRQAVCRKKRLEQDYEEFISTFAMCKSPIITDMPTGSHDDAGLEKYFPQMEEYKEEIWLQIAECNKIRQEIAKAINSIEGKNSETHISLLTYRYILGHSWLQIADEDLFMDYNYVRGELHGKALNQLNI